MQSNRSRLNRHIASEKWNLRRLSQQDQAATQADAQASAIEAFSRIRTLVKGVNPLGLLARICVQCGFHEASVTGAVESYASGWASWSGIIARLVCSGDCGTPNSADPTRETVDALSEAFLEYWNGVTPPDPMEDSSSHADIVRTLAEECRMHAVTVKHDAQPYQFYEAAERLYSPENEWLKENLGFTIQEALATMRGISDTVVSRLNRAIATVTQGFTPAMIEETKFREVMLPALDRDPDMAILTEEDIAAACSVSRKACIAVLARFSQHIKDYPGEDSSRITLDPLQLPFEFNQICARPLIEIDGRYVCPELHLLSEAVFLGPHFNLIQDNSVQGTYGNDRGAWLEQLAGEYLRSVFGPESVCVNPYRDDGNELCDVLVYYDNIVVVVSCKAKMLTALAEYGNDVVRLKDDLQKGIGDSYTQVEGTLTYLRHSDTVAVFRPNGELWTTIKSAELDAILPVYVLPTRYQNLTINVRDILSGLGLRVNADTLPWIVSVFDLQDATEILDETPALFLHYLVRRREMALAPTNVEGDEMDLLGNYLTQGLYFGRGSHFSKKNSVFLFNSSAAIDLYLGTVHHGLGKDAQRPRCAAPFVLSGMLAEIDQIGAPHRTVSALRLLELPGKGQIAFLDHIASCRMHALTTSEPSIYTTGVKPGSTVTWITYCAGAGGSPAAVEQARNWARGQLEPGRRGTWEWVCLVGDSAGSGRVQSVIYVPPHETREKPL